MEDLTINEIDLNQLIDIAITNNNTEALYAFKSLVECMIAQHAYECECNNDQILDDWEIVHMQVIKKCLTKLIDKINRTLK